MHGRLYAFPLLYLWALSLSLAEHGLLWGIFHFLTLVDVLLLVNGTALSAMNVLWCYKIAKQSDKLKFGTA